ncbi:hypothetical protein A6302_02542 [Methylobrevis pamukkalensis]|uniref:ACR n=1 Tax=Methylobrevis pamukkalensis TaxID=1439726 RepID=A0A1E3H1C6_9HYPH|nr:hypothetical protein A6302_02542 [Methylobrevis pamukkalensis]
MELALTADQRSEGLMYRREMAPDHGMLFDMERVAPAHFWMRNTYISLDIIFIEKNGRVATIAANTEPLSERMIGSGVPVRFVLELVAGTAAKIGLAPGDRVDHPVIAAAQ